MIDWREYTLEADADYIVVEHEICGSTTGSWRTDWGSGMFVGIGTIQDALDWALDHEARVHNAHGGE